MLKSSELYSTFFSYKQIASANASPPAFCAAPKEQPTSIAEKAGEYYILAFDYNGNFNRNEELILAVENLTKEQSVEVLTKVLANSFSPQDDGPVIIFGASEAGQKAYEITTQQAVVIAFADNDTKKHGSNFCDVPVISPEQIPSLQFSAVLIASMYAKEIHAQLLLELGLEYEKVHLFEMQD